MLCGKKIVGPPWISNLDPLVVEAGSPAPRHGRPEADWQSGPSGGRRWPACGSRSREGAEAVEWRSVGVRREAAKHKQGGTALGWRQAATTRRSAAPVGAGVRRWAEKTTLNIFSPNLKVGHDPPVPPYRSAPAARWCCRLDEERGWWPRTCKWWQCVIVLSNMFRWNTFCWRENTPLVA
jgi:hypothetical protein